MKRIAVYAGGACIIVATCWVAYAVLFTLQPKADSSPAAPVSHQQESTPPQPAEAPVMAVPTELDIPAVALTAPIEPVGLTRENNMDVPSSETVMGWYQHGVFPGNRGSAVLAGHTGYPDRPAPFRQLEALKTGDAITIKDAQASTATFKVVEVAKYPVDQSPRQRIFGHTNESQLVLITCSGTWLPAKRTYSDRLVVYSIRDS